MEPRMSEGLVLYAPNVHTGGGLTLLRALLHAWPANRELRAILDERARNSIQLPPLYKVSWTAPSLKGRFGAERKLAAIAGPEDTVFSFHGLPPLYRSRGRVVVYLQSPLLVGLMRLRDFSLRIAARVAVERVISRAFRQNVSEYLVQTPTMVKATSAWHGRAMPVQLLPFRDRSVPVPTMHPVRDFIYVSDGLPHKNHDRLLQAWELLAQDGLRPTLALTLGPRDQALAARVEALVARCGVRIENVGHVSHDRVLQMYAQSRALIFPSLGESFGLPLIEAGDAELPILAPELDYVRDVCCPVQTFDPTSPVSIARAVKRFLRCAEQVPRIPTADAVWAALGITSNAGVPA